MGLTPKVYDHLVFNSGNKASDINGVTVVETFYKYRPITPLPKFITNILLNDGDGIIIKQPRGLLHDRRVIMKNILNNQKGAILVIFALSLTVLVGFAALGTEVGRWYLRGQNSQKQSMPPRWQGQQTSRIRILTFVSWRKTSAWRTFSPGIWERPEPGISPYRSKPLLRRAGN